MLHDRTCSVCGLYFIFKKMEKFSCSRVTPTNIVRYRNQEALCILEDSFGQEPNLECFDIESIESELLNLEESNKDCQLPIVKNIREWIRSPWTESA